MFTLPAVRRHNFFRDGQTAPALSQQYDGTAESAAGQSRPVNPVVSPGQIDQQVNFGNRYIVVVALRIMRAIEELP